MTENNSDNFVDNSTNTHDNNSDNNSDNNLNNILNSFNSENGDMNIDLEKTLKEGDLGNMVKQFTNIMSSLNQNNENVESEEECDEEMEDEDFVLDLNKYFIASNGKNICDVLLDIKEELKNINNKLQ